MSQVSPFSREILNRIFAISPKHPDRLVSRESSWLEFKEAFGFQNLGKYIRSAGAFANAGGGYIVYGVQDSPHRLVGLKDNRFDQLDPEKLTEYLNQHFDPEIEWGRHLHELSGRVFGILYFYESRNKPVICRVGTDDGKSLKEGEIYYRYKGRTQTIRYAELKELIEVSRKQEQLLWFRHLKEIARIGINEAAIFDLRGGKGSGAAGHFIIDESLLSQISFIREGEFDERKGKPTLKIIGEARSLGNSPAWMGGKAHIVKTKGIRAPDIIVGFLRSERITEPQSYFTQICYESTAFLPLYYLLKQANISLEQAAAAVNDEQSTLPAKARLLERLKDDSSLKVPLPSARNAAGRRKVRIREMLLNGQVSIDPDTQCLKDLLKMIRTLQPSDLDDGFVKGHLEHWFNKHFAQGDSAINGEIRRTICYMDWLLNRSDVVAIEEKGARAPELGQPDGVSCDSVEEAPSLEAQVVGVNMTGRNHSIIVR